ncbi:MAG: ABC transporter ATP-binding protein [Actinomycetota bacterium]
MTDSSGLAARVVVTLGTLALDAPLEVPPGETTVVVGPNGAGKTTLLRALAGLRPVDRGFVRVDEVTLDDPAAGVFLPPERRPIGVVFQDGLLFPHLDARANVAFGLRARGMRKQDAEARAIDWLVRVGLDDATSSRPLSLSGGQAQRVALARALAPAPRMLLLDEPLAALDAAARVDVRGALRKHLAAYDGVRVMVTHDPLEALTFADRIVVLEDGRVAQVGTPDEVRAHPASGYVASLLGTNVLRGVCDSAESFRLESGATLSIAVEQPVAGAAVAVIEPSAVTLYREQPHVSARNTWATVVTDVDREPARVRVRFADPVPLVADVTHAAAADLDLRQGSRVWCAVKATAIVVRPA